MERYSLMLNTKVPTPTRHILRLRILVQNQFYQCTPPRAHQHDQHRRNQPNTWIIYSSTNPMYANTRRRKWSKRNNQRDLWRYRTWLKPTLRNPLCQHTTTASLVFVLCIPSYLWTKSKKNYGTVHQNKLQENKIALDAQWYPTTPIVVLLTHIEY